MVDTRYLGKPKDDLSKIARIEVAFKKQKKYRAYEFSESELVTFLGQFTNNYANFKYRGEQVDMYADFYKYSDGTYAFVLSEQPIETEWWEA